MTAAANGHTTRVNYLLRLGADIDLSDERGLTALHHAAYSGWEDTVETLLSNGANSEAQAELWGTPLHLAAIKGRINIVRALLRYRAVVNSESGLLGSPLHCACMAGDLACAQALLDGAAALDTIARVHHHPATLGSAHAWIMEFAESSRGAIVECQPLVLAVMSDSAQLVDLLLLHGGCANSRVKWSEFLRPALPPGDITWQHTNVPLLSFAAMVDKGEMCDRLLKGGADLHATTETVKTALYVAALTGRSQACEVLIANGADPYWLTDKGWTPLTAAASRGHDECVALLLRTETSSESQKREHQAMITALQWGHVKVVERLREHKPSALTFVDHKQRTALHVALFHLDHLAKDGKALAMMEYLLAHGVDPLAKDGEGRTALDISSHWQQKARESDEALIAVCTLLRKATDQASRKAARKEGRLE